MKDCVQNLVILILISLLIFSIINYFKNKQMQKNINTTTDIAKIVNNNLYTITPSVNTLSDNIKNVIIAKQVDNIPMDTPIICPIDNNIVNHNEIDNENLDENYHAFVYNNDNNNDNDNVNVNDNNNVNDNDNNNVTIIEENNHIEEANKFNYIKKFSNNFHGFDLDEVYPSF